MNNPFKTNPTPKRVNRVYSTLLSKKLKERSIRLRASRASDYFIPSENNDHKQMIIDLTKEVNRNFSFQMKS